MRSDPHTAQSLGDPEPCRRRSGMRHKHLVSDEGSRRSRKALGQMVNEKQASRRELIAVVVVANGASEQRSSLGWPHRRSVVVHLHSKGDSRKQSVSCVHKSLEGLGVASGVRVHALGQRCKCRLDLYGTSARLEAEGLPGRRGGGCILALHPGQLRFQADDLQPLVVDQSLLRLQGLSQL